jgi:hypothetical protein
MAQLFWLSGQQLSDGNGAPYIAAKAYFYETGSTTPKATYSNAGLTSANANPVVADANGRFGDIYLVAGRYKVVLTTSADVAIDTLDPVDGTSQLISVASAPATTYPFLRYHNTTDGNVYRRNAADTAWINEGSVDSLINAASVTEVLTGTDAAKAVTPDALAGLWQRGTDIASGTTLSLPATGGGVFNVTGTSTVSGISSAQGGRCVKLRFASSLTLTHNATSFILPGAANIIASSGDVAEFVNEAAQDASGSNWRCFNYMPSLGVPLAAPAVGSKTANYTVTDGDRGALIRFSALGADVTLTLPAAANRAGFLLYVVNDDSGDTTSYGVTVDPNGSETIDGVTTRKGYTGTRVTLLCDGTGWRTVSGKWRYFSGNQTLTLSSNTALTHGLGFRPRMVWAELRCDTANLNYSAGDTLSIIDLEGGSGSAGIGVYYDGTTLNLRVGNNVFIPDKTTLASTAVLTAANWRVRVYAED